MECLGCLKPVTGPLLVCEPCQEGNQTYLQEVIARQRVEVERCPTCGYLQSRCICPAKPNPYAFDADLLLGPKDGFWAIIPGKAREEWDSWQKTAHPSSMPVEEILPRIQAANPGKTIQVI